MDQSWHLGCRKNTYNGPSLKPKSGVGALGKERTREGGGVGWEWERK